MPIYMDRHDIPKDITAAHVAEMHQVDLKVEHLYECRGLTYWCDDKKSHAFCLIEAPNIEAIQKMHEHAHGEFPYSIIEVDEKLVTSFLGRIEDPKNESDNELNIVDDSAFRAIMVIEINNYSYGIDVDQLSLFRRKFHENVLKTVEKFEGSIVKQDDFSYLISFKSITNSIFCALQIQSDIEDLIPKFNKSNNLLNIAISSGTPVTTKDTIFEEVIALTTRMCENVDGKIIISNEVKNLFGIEKRNYILDKT